MLSIKHACGRDRRGGRTWMLTSSDRTPDCTSSRDGYFEDQSLYRAISSCFTAYRQLTACFMFSLKCYWVSYVVNAAVRRATRLDERRLEHLFCGSFASGNLRSAFKAARVHRRPTRGSSPRCCFVVWCEGTECSGAGTRCRAAYNRCEH